MSQNLIWSFADNVFRGTRVKDGWLLAGTLPSSSCFLAGLQRLFALCDLFTDEHPDISLLSLSSRRDARMCISTIEIQHCRRCRRRRRRKVNLTNELSRISYITRVTTLERKYLFTYDTRDSSLVVHYCKILNSNILSFFFLYKKSIFSFFLLCNFSFFNDNEISHKTVKFTKSKSRTIRKK